MVLFFVSLKRSSYNIKYHCLCLYTIDLSLYITNTRLRVHSNKSTPTHEKCGKSMNENKVLHQHFATVFEILMDSDILKVFSWKF